MINSGLKVSEGKKISATKFLQNLDYQQFRQDMKHIIHIPTLNRIYSYHKNIK